MKKKIILIIIFGILLFFWVHFFSIISYYYTVVGNGKLDHKDFTGALDSFMIANIYNDTLETKYNLGIGQYGVGNYDDAQKIFEELLKNNREDTLQFKLFHNLGNVYFYQGMKYFPNEESIPLFEKSIEMYSQALTIKNDTVTLKSKKYVEDLLEKLKKKQEQEQNTQEQENTSSPQDTDNQQEPGKEKKPNEDGAQEQQKTEKQEEKKEEPSTGSSSQRDESYKLQQEDAVEQPSENERAYIENRMDILQETQESHQDLLGGPKRENKDFFDAFREDMFFTDIFGGKEKDW